MTITNGYTTLAQFRQRYFPGAAADADRDAGIELIIGAASRKIDLHCGRSFYSDTADSTRYFTAESQYRCYIDDCQSITTLYTDDDGDQTYENTWTTSDFYLLPSSLPYGWPYLYLEVTPQGDYSFPRRLRKGVKIVGTFGWAAVPEPVREACLMLSNRMWQRRNAPFGVQGPNDFGVQTVITKLDPDIMDLLSPYARMIP